MGNLIGRFRSQRSAKEQLADIEEEIVRIEARRRHAQSLQNKTIGYFVFVCIVLYLFAAVFFYFYYSPRDWAERLILFSPFVVFPFLFYGIKKLLTYAFVEQIRRNDVRLSEIRHKKRHILDNVKETETFKVAEEILKKYDTEYRETRAPRLQPSSRMESQLRHRRPANDDDNSGARPLPQVRRHVSLPTAQAPPPPPPPPPQQQIISPQRSQPVLSSQQREVYQLMPGYVARPAPGPPSPCPILPRERTTLDKMVEYIIGDGANNRYALICKKCYSHNGMALPDDYEYLTFRCAYCYEINEARKKKPNVDVLVKEEATKSDEKPDDAATAAAADDDNNKED
ncbi:endoplasmic reticulum junction formation protein lunapark-like [Oscarella lobularis]|uniref:endoplasmic reticulum junction formation protein lunapark-like n=1 Tax=Oscarella lobularis TaxID=121494 RepID=UPI003314340B